MGQILLVGKTNELNNVYSLNFNVYLGREVIMGGELENVFEHLNNSDQTHLIFISSSAENTAPMEIYKFLKTKNFNIPILSLVDEPRLKTNIVVLDFRTELKHIIQAAAKLLGVTAQEMAQKDVPEFFPIPIKYFYFLEKVICHTYVREKDDNGQNEFVKRFSAGENYPTAEITKFFELGISSLYVEKNNRLLFVNSVTQHIASKLNDGNLDEDDKMKLTDNGMNILSNLLLTRGMTDETVELARASIKAVQTSVKKTTELGKLLDSLLNSKTSFRYRRCILETFVSAQIVQNMEWGSAEQQEKLAFVSFFHDIVLESDKLARIASEDDLKKAVLTTEEQERALGHARQVSELVSKYPSIPIGAEMIILQH
ncbi:MAG: hypothetical protein WCG27_08500, partial [Pseudomonadota bacterium]